MRRRPLPQEIQGWIEIVVADNADDLLRYFRRRVNEPEEAADLLGRLFLALWEKGGRVPTTDEGARMWCFGIARNVLREHRRKATKAIGLANALRDHIRDAPQPDNSADASAEKMMRAGELRRVMKLLDERTRELLMLIYWDNFSIADAARLLSINESTARTRHGRALRRLEATLQYEEQRIVAQRDFRRATVADTTQ
ncbi:RNA polymerase sigma factor [Microbacterium sp. A93]|uniref:RNA polymerase sigma factor n=1 Tax=Microbacterium sp. A93 TaxID=3450716 RepID=UPI003F43AF82